ncbi:putative transmembrane protein [Mycolicibacter terrae]|nr:Tat (twin-arginine translocation) pathway signal sequence [Mycolicibacter terrae]ORW89228.1 Tat (twin-arginine translocation) pathway signal sequence [Mycolicibacter terrae]SNV53064.1 putative transmembrane protein [Mycolicibacter terrae]
MAGGMAAGGTAGAGAGTAAKRLAEHQDLQHKVDAVARQAPNLAWAAGLRDDETTIVVVTDLAGGWIPPTVKLPPGVALLDPAHRRRSTSAMDLLGAVIAAATHEPNTYITEADPGDPVPGSGERARYGQRLDELGPTLIDAAGASTRLPRIVQTVAQAMARRSGVADNEVELFRQVVADTATRVVSAYPEHAPRDVADWMLLAAIDALIEGSEELAHYHLAWHQAVGVPHGGFTP